MKIGIDISQTAYGGTGVARYTSALLKGLMKYDKTNEYILFFSSLRQSVPPFIKDNLPSNFQLKQYHFPPSMLNFMWNKLHIVPIERIIGDLDVFMSSDWIEPPTLKAKKITTIHDLVPFKFPETSQNKTKINWKKITLQQNIVDTHKSRLEWVKKESTIITCNSYATQKDVEEILHIPKEKLRVIYPGIDLPEIHTNDKEINEKYHISKSYILTVGTLQPRKNILRLIHAYRAAKVPDVDLYIVGMQGWGDEVKIEDDNIHLLGYVPDEDLVSLYKNALFFIYPALYEGFGYPVAEAMKMGCAVATSDSSSLKEIAEKSALLFDPLSEDSIARAIHTLTTDGKLRKELQEKAVKKAETFSIENFAKQFIKVFEELQ